MFDVSWSELLILGIVTLIFVGPKELPVFMRTLGRYAGSVKRQAAEFRSQFDAAMREAELDSMRKEMEAMQASVNSEIMSVESAVNDAAAPPRPASAPHEQPVLPEPEPENSTAELPSPPLPAPPRMEP
ncbi:MAG TPA: Sec-independent protein translocase protein TatB [Hyphomicrobium sp.]|nr:Sec-independent protein translocase protein TatB [Hyphomicrobium sp.]